MQWRTLARYGRGDVTAHINHSGRPIPTGGHFQADLDMSKDMSLLKPICDVVTCGAGRRGLSALVRWPLAHGRMQHALPLAVDGGSVDAGGG